MDKQQAIRALRRADQVARRAMFDLLRDAYANDWRVTLDYSIVDLKKNGVIMRVALAK